MYNFQSLKEYQNTHIGTYIPAETFINMFLFLKIGIIIK